MKRPLALTAALVLLAAPVAAQESVRPDLVREILRRRPEWPGVQVEIPAEVYEAYVRDLVAKPVPPQPPEVAWIHHATYRLVLVADPGAPPQAERPAGNAAQGPYLEAEFDLVYLAGEGAAPLALLHNALAWSEVMLDGRAIELRQADDGWFTLDPLEVGRHRLTAHAPLKPVSEAGVLSAEWRTPPAAWTVAAVESDEAWEVRFSRSAGPIVGDEVAGTHGATGMLAGEQVRAEWRRPQPPVRRTARVEVESHVGWTIADGVHQVRAVLDLRLWGGEAEEFMLDLPAGVDRVEVTGPDVREVQTSGDRTKVFLRGAITQRTRLALAFEVPRPVTGRMTLPAFGVAGARGSGGTLGIAGGGGGVLLEMDSPGLEATAIHDLPRETRGLLAAPPVLAYRLAPGPWEARVDLVALAEFPVRETLVDSALTTVLYRPDGRVMTKVIYEVRNRSQQYMRVDLPPGATLLVARVAEEQRSLARGPGSTLYVPLEKSVLTTATPAARPQRISIRSQGSPAKAQGLARIAAAATKRTGSARSSRRQTSTRPMAAETGSNWTRSVSALRSRSDPRADASAVTAKTSARFTPRMVRIRTIRPVVGATEDSRSGAPVGGEPMETPLCRVYDSRTPGANQGELERNAGRAGCVQESGTGRATAGQRGEGKREKTNGSDLSGAGVDGAVVPRRGTASGRSLSAKGGLAQWGAAVGAPCRQTAGYGPWRWARHGCELGRACSYHPWRRGSPWAASAWGAWSGLRLAKRWGVLW